MAPSVGKISSSRTTESVDLEYMYVKHFNKDLPAGRQGTWTSKAFFSSAGVSIHSSICRTPIYSRSGCLNQQLLPSSSTFLKPERRRLAFLRASVSNVSSDNRSLDSDNDDSVEDSSDSIVEDSLSVSGEAPVSEYGGKPGFVSFYSAGSGKEQPESTEYQELQPAHTGRGSLLWLLGPLALVVSVVGPPLYLRRFFESILEDSLLTGMLFLFSHFVTPPYEFLHDGLGFERGNFGDQELLKSEKLLDVRRSYITLYTSFLGAIYLFKAQL